MKFTSSEDETRVRLEPVGSVELLEQHEHDILSREGTPADWIKWFNDWSREDAGIATASRESVSRAKELQTPAKRNPRSSFGVVSSAVGDPPASKIPESDLEFGLSLYDQLWSTSADSAALLLPDAFSVGSLIKDSIAAIGRLAGAMESLHHEQVDSTAWTESNVDLISRRVTDLELNVGEPPSNFGLSSTLWGSVAEVASISETKLDSSDVVASQASNIAQFEAMFTSVQTLEHTMARSIRTLETRIGDVEEQLLGGESGRSSQASSSDMATIMSELASLRAQQASDKARIEALEAQQDAGSLRVEVTPGGTVLRSAQDVANFLQSIGAGSAGYGGFVDIYNLLYRIQDCIEEGPSITEVTKNSKDVMQLSMNEDEVVVGYTFRSPVPSYFGGKKTSKTYIPKLPEYSKWRSAGLSIIFTKFGIMCGR